MKRSKPFWSYRKREKPRRKRDLGLTKPKAPNWSGFAFPKGLADGDVPRLELSQREYADLVLLVRDLDGGRCRNPNCKTPKLGLQAHHMIPRSQIRLDREDNLLTVCMVCHQKVTEKRLSVRWVDSHGETLPLAYSHRKVHWKQF